MAQAVQLSAWKKALFAVVAVGGSFGLLEGALALAGVRPRIAYEDPYVGFAKTIPLFVRDGDRYVTSPAKTGWFNRQQFSADKPAGTVRVFSMGGSTTYGRPYNDDVSFSGWLRGFLPEADPTRQWEVVNAGGVSYASYRVAAVMEELAGYEPDLFVIYSGHNEFLERRTYKGLIETPETLSAAAGLLSRTRIYAVGSKLLSPWSKRNVDDELLAEEVDTMLAHSVGPQEYERDDEFRAQVLSHYRFNLRRMVEIARAAGAEAVLVTTAANWKDSSPFKSQHRDGLSEGDAAHGAELRERGVSLREEGRFGESLEALDAAATVDALFAETHYERGRTLLELGRSEDAKAAFRRALEEDVCPLRSFPEMNDVVREVAASTGAPLVDFAAHVESRAEDGIPGAEQFLDHVHLNLDGYRDLALLLVDEMERSGRLTKAATWNDETIAAVQARVEASVDREAQARAMKNLARVFVWAGRMDEAARIAEQALDELGDNADAFNTLGRAATEDGRNEEAMELFRKALELDRGHPNANTNLGAELFNLDQIEEAVPHFQAALESNPRFWQAHLNLGLAMSALGDTEAGERYLRRALELEPRSHEAHNNLGAELVDQGRMQEAVEHFREAVKIQPLFAEGYGNLGEALTQLGLLEEAEAELRRALEIGPETATMHYNLGVALQHAGRLEEGVVEYSRAIEMDPTLSGALNNRAVALLELGRDEEAIADLRRAIEVDPEFARTHPELTAILEGAE